MQTAEQWLRFCADKLEKSGVFFGHGTDNAYDEAAWMLLHILCAPLDGSFSNWEIMLSEEQAEELKTLLSDKKIQFIIEPYIRFKGESGEQATMFFLDPEGNALEFKSFKNLGNLFSK